MQQVPSQRQGGAISRSASLNTNLFSFFFLLVFFIEKPVLQTVFTLREATQCHPIPYPDRASFSKPCGETSYYYDYSLHKCVLRGGSSED